jgi:hypothetical protein
MKASLRENILGQLRTGFPHGATVQQLVTAIYGWVDDPGEYKKRSLKVYQKLRALEDSEFVSRHVPQSPHQYDNPAHVWSAKATWQSQAS